MTDKKVGGLVKNMGGPIILLYLIMFEIKKKLSKMHFLTGKAWKVLTVSEWGTFKHIYEQKFMIY